MPRDGPLRVKYLSGHRTGVHRDSPARLEAFSDGVFAIAITLLVLELRLPERAPGESVAQAVLHEWPAIFAFLASFLLVGLFWVHHHHMLSLVARVDHRLLQLNLLLLLAIAAMPFFTLFLAAFLAEPVDRSAVLVYGAGIFFACAAWCANWWYVTGRPDLLAKPLSRSFVRVSRGIYGVGPIGYLAATGLATLSAAAAIVIFLGLPLVYFLPRGFPGERNGPWAWLGVRPSE